MAAPSWGGCGDDMALRLPGRPKDLEKREAILDAAQALFAQRGVDGCPIEAIAAQSGVSKVTVYANFGDKAKIFDAIVQRETERLSRALACATAEGATLEERLTRFGTALVEMMTAPCHLALDKCVTLRRSAIPRSASGSLTRGRGRCARCWPRSLPRRGARCGLTMPTALRVIFWGCGWGSTRLSGGCAVAARLMRWV